ncbi:hypothetical protein DFP91_4406 [Pseudorhodoplanes sinuspersici]|nr:hypothetical protein DFP91_4406 [Pseudorhodoplanes sinuspersici]
MNVKHRVTAVLMTLLSFIFIISVLLTSLR